MVDVIPFAQSAYTCPRLNCFYHKYSCRQVFRSDFPCEIRNWNRKKKHKHTHTQFVQYESIEKKIYEQIEHDKARPMKTVKNITIC